MKRIVSVIAKIAAWVVLGGRILDPYPLGGFDIDDFGE